MRNLIIIALQSASGAFLLSTDGEIPATNVLILS